MNALDLIARAMASREALGLHVHWRLPSGEVWSAYAKDDEQKAAWIASKAKAGWVYLPDMDCAVGPHSAAVQA